MNHAREAIGAVQCVFGGQIGSGISDARLVVPIAGERAHKATRGENCEPAAHAGTPPLHFPLEPLGGVLEKLDAEKLQD